MLKRTPSPSSGARSEADPNNVIYSFIAEDESDDECGELPDRTPARKSSTEPLRKHSGSLTRQPSQLSGNKTPTRKTSGSLLRSVTKSVGTTLRRYSSNPFPSSTHQRSGPMGGLRAGVWYDAASDSLRVDVYEARWVPLFIESQFRR